MKASELYELVLVQMVAEAYLDEFDITNPEQLARALSQGNNRVAHIPTRNIRFTAVQSEEFRRSATVVHQLSEDPNGSIFRDSTGLSATLTARLDGSGNRTGEYVLSIRSTEFPPAGEGGDRWRDALGGADQEIFRTGFALAQLASLEDYYAWLKDTAFLPADARLTVTGYSLGGHLATVFTELHSQEIEQTVVFNGAGRGSLASAWRLLPGVELSIRTLLDLYRGTLEDPGSWTDQLWAVPVSPVSVALRGAASVAGEVIPLLDIARPGDGDLYDSPRHQWATWVASSITHGVGSPLVRLAGSGAVLDPAADAKILDVFGHATHDDQEAVASVGISASTRQYVFIEDQPAYSGYGGFAANGDFGNTHSLTLIADSLALQRTLQRIESQIGAQTLQAILASASNLRAYGGIGASGRAEADSLENALYAFSRLLVGAAARQTPVVGSEGGFGDLASRDAFHGNLAALEAAAADLAEAGLIFRIVPLVPAGQFSTANGEPLAGAAPMRAAELLALALQDSADGAAVRFALREMNPFVLFVEGGLLPAYEDAAIASVDAAADRYGGHSRAYWADRAALLERRLFVNVHNLDNDLQAPVNAAGSTLAYGVGAFPYLYELRLYEDLDSGYMFRAQPGEAVLERVVFGRANESNTVAGTQAVDRIHGGSAADTLHGAAGNDLLDGGAGDDFLVGGAGDDTLQGGEGADVLDGGAGADRLVGGSGYDTYVLQADAGYDTVIDADGVGELVLDGQVLTGGTRSGIGRYVSGDGAIRYELLSDSPDGSGTSTLLVDGRVQVVGFRNGDLGIRLDDVAPDIREAPALTGYVYVGSSLPEGFVNAGGEDLVRGSAGNDVLVSAWRNTAGDIVLRGAAPGTYYGRAGDDVFEGAYHFLDYFDGGSGDDIIDGGADGVVLPWYGFSRSGDLLAGGAGNDLIRGSDQDDVVHGDYRTAVIRADASEVILGALRATRMADGTYSIVYRSGLDSDQPVTIPQPLPDLDSVLAYALGVPVDEAGMLSYDDTIFANDGNDTVYGGAGSDEIYGGDGNDTIYTDHASDAGSIGIGIHSALLGGYGDDYADGGAGDDVIVDQRGGSDTLLGGAGNDRISNRDVISWTPSAAGLIVNTLDGGAGNDVIESQSGSSGSFDIVTGGAGEDRIDVSAARLFIDGGEGEDVIDAHVGWGSELNRVHGGDGNDTISVYDGATIDAGAGDDQVMFRASNGGGRVVLGPGSDTLHLHAFDTVTIDQSGRHQDDFDRLLVEELLGAGIPGAAAVTVSRNGSDLVLSPTSPRSQRDRDSRILVRDWFSGPAFGFEEIVLADGTVWTRDTIDALVAAGAYPDGGDPDGPRVARGTSGDDELRVRAFGAVLEGGPGDDVLRAGRPASDVSPMVDLSLEVDLPLDPYTELAGGRFPSTASFYAGGAGDDRIDAAERFDVVGFNAGDGHDTLTVRADATVSVAGVDVEDITLTRVGDALTLTLGVQDSISFEGWFGAGEVPQGVQLQLISPSMISLYDLDAIASQLSDQVTGTDGDTGATYDGVGSPYVSAGDGFDGDDVDGDGPDGDGLDGEGPDLPTGDDAEPVSGVSGSPGEGGQAGPTTTPPVTLAPGAHWSDYRIAAYDDAAVGGRLAHAYATSGTTAQLTNADLVASLNADFGIAAQPLGLGHSLNERIAAPGSGVIVQQPQPGVDTLRFAEGISPADISLGVGSLEIRFGTSGDAVRLTDVDPDDAATPGSITRFVFADGTVLTHQELVARGFDLNGTTGDDVIKGTSLEDRIFGGPGNDVLNGGAGRDTYIFSSGDGNDTIVESVLDGADNVIRFLDVESGDVVFRNGAIEIPRTGQRIAINLPDRIAQLQLADGSRYVLSSLPSTIERSSPPSIAPLKGDEETTLEAQADVATEAASYSYTPLAVHDYTRESADGGDSVPVPTLPGESTTAVIAPIGEAIVSVPAMSPRGSDATGVATDAFLSLPGWEFGWSWPESVTGDASVLARASDAWFSMWSVPARDDGDGTFGVLVDARRAWSFASFDQLVQTGRAVSGQELIEAIDAFKRRTEAFDQDDDRSEAEADEIARRHARVHAWLERNPGFSSDDEEGTGDGAWFGAWSGSVRPDRTATGVAAESVPGLANPHALPSLRGAGAMPGLPEGLNALLR